MSEEIKKTEASEIPQVLKFKEAAAKAPAHKHKEEPFVLKTFIKDSISILVGIVFATVGLEFFIVPNKLLDGGVTGISLLLTFLTHWDVSIFIFILNLPFVFMGYKQVGKLFAIKT